MKIFTPLYDTCLRWAKHRHAEKYLAGLSCAESTFFPIPPDVMLAPMVLGQTHKAWRFALVCTIASVIGGIIGYALGYFAFESWLAPLIEQWGYAEKLALAEAWFAKYGVWVVFIAGFSPIPYKIFTISAGALAMAFFPFVIASTIGRGMRFFLVAAFMKYGGPPMEAKLKDYIEYLGWAVIIAAIVAYLILR
ncbi:YqaA family protein [Glaciecola petra]|uniref:YqaA family protein n=1 Tax=Glaciecola petra TaxID=3075602 RepID=A0ABU2ZMM3_9ALTE|nr:YqaA family protein [Aestuariibacter sp. P117]MDT0593288.1 YqaA family protein [Aestuariibacter sp. P117]